MPLVTRQLAVIEMTAVSKGRLDHVRQALPTWLAQECPTPWTLTLLDYACPDDTWTWTLRNCPPEVTALRFQTDSPLFNWSHARNLSVRDSHAPVFAFIDADNLLHPHWLRDATRELLNGTADIAHTFWTHGTPNRGTCTVTAQLHHTLRGFDETLTGYGNKDRDYYRRATERGTATTWTTDQLTCIYHSNELRTAHYANKDRNASMAANYTAQLDTSRPINPTGYGLGTLTTANPPPPPTPQTLPNGAFTEHEQRTRPGYFDAPLALALIHDLTGQTVYDFGAGLALYTTQLRRHGIDAYAFDATPHTAELTNGEATEIDLAQPIRLPPADTVLCLEVGEHIPPQFTPAFVHNLARHARQTIILSWAVPGQKGTGHVNCRTNDEVAGLLAAHCWQPDPPATQRLREIASRWFKTTLQVFRRA